MKYLLRLFIFVALIAIFASCATLVDVTGYLDPAHRTFLVPGKSVSVVQNPNADNPLLEKEVASKIARLLEQQGYNLSTSEDADFRLTFNYGMGRGPLHTGTIRHHKPGRTETIRSYDPHSGTWSSQTVNIPGSTSYEPYSVQYHTRSLSIRVFDARKFRESGQKEVLWAADTMSEGESSDLRDVLNYLLVATFEHFGKDTGQAVRVKLTPADSRVRHLKEK
jgi:hypothetical protein